MLDEGKRQQVMEHCGNYRNAKRFQPVTGVWHSPLVFHGRYRQVSETAACVDGDALVHQVVRACGKTGFLP
jgi:hypothetical protein